MDGSEYQKLKQKNKIVFLYKKGVGAHRGLGVDLFDDKLEAKLMKEYNGGNFCGKIKNNIVM